VAPTSLSREALSSRTPDKHATTHHERGFGFELRGVRILELTAEHFLVQIERTDLGRIHSVAAAKAIGVLSASRSRRSRSRGNARRH